MRSRWIGILIAAIGAFLLMQEWGWSWRNPFASWETILIVVGVGIIFYSFIRSNRPNLLIWGGIVTGLGVHAWGQSHISGWPDHWSLVPAIIGLSFFLWGGLVHKNRRHVIIGIMLMLLGLLAWPGVAQLPIIGHLAGPLHAYWPALLIVLGLILTVKK
ncbi:hypothetical protein [Desmospora profundinema]|uniref:CHASE2 domain-containing sensor protein n=1 Tax=Desmospora profundinema TaxID=1571184 RepID=A0ABU1INV9_9BACL|nr:hypothetical protein [Desmospora profundinema]MDR6226453.1 CHASE2 domain-containing sensor protein [Desmospora profundinema]